jgi:hypothetical protein
MFEDVLWPTKEDYDDVVMNNLRDRVFDRDLNHGKLAETNTGILRLGGANLYTCIYKIDQWIMRCFCRTEHNEPPPAVQQRYKYISDFCRQHSTQTSALVPVYYIENGIEVDCLDRSSYVVIETAKFPIVKMPFVTGLPLGSFIAANHQNSVKMQRLCDAWFHMIYELETIQMAHGDLDLTNVVVVQKPAETKITLKLIDYDNVWIPTVAAYKQPEFGHEPFQHPAFFSKERPYNAEMDRFSALVIYISLKALTTHPALYRDDKWGADDTHRLLLSASDYKAEQRGSPSGRIQQLRAMNIQGLEPYLDDLSYALHKGCMPRSLNEIASTPPTRHNTIHVEPPRHDTTEWSRSDPYPDWDRAVYFSDNVRTSPKPLSSSPVKAVGWQEPEPEPTLPQSYPAPTIPGYQPPTMNAAQAQAATQRVYKPEAIQVKSVTPRSAEQPARTDLATWIGCGILLIIIIAVIVSIFLLVPGFHV